MKGVEGSRGERTGDEGIHYEHKRHKRTSGYGDILMQSGLVKVR